MTQLNLDLNRAKPAQLRAMYRAAMATVTAEWGYVRSSSKGREYPAPESFDRLIDAVRQVRLLAAHAIDGAPAEVAGELPS